MPYQAPILRLLPIIYGYTTVAFHSLIQGRSRNRIRQSKRQIIQRKARRKSHCVQNRSITLARVAKNEESTYLHSSILSIVNHFPCLLNRYLLLHQPQNIIVARFDTEKN